MNRREFFGRSILTIAASLCGNAVQASGVNAAKQAIFDQMLMVPHDPTFGLVAPIIRGSQANADSGPLIEVSFDNGQTWSSDDANWRQFREQQKARAAYLEHKYGPSTYGK